MFADSRLLRVALVMTVGLGLCAHFSGAAIVDEIVSDEVAVQIVGGGGGDCSDIDIKGACDKEFFKFPWWESCPGGILWDFDPAFPPCDTAAVNNDPCYTACLVHCGYSTDLIFGCEKE